MNILNAMPTARAGHEPSQQAVSAVPVTIPIADVPGIWRCGVGDAVHAVDCFTRELLGSRRKKDREIGAVLDRVLQAIVEARMMASPTNYGEANSAGKMLRAQAIEARRAETGTGSVHESAVAEPCAQGDAA